jgi:hypothetical protein
MERALPRRRQETPTHDRTSKWREARERTKGGEEGHLERSTDAHTVRT